jgi:hypothetical protein
MGLYLQGTRYVRDFSPIQILRDLVPKARSIYSDISSPVIIDRLGGPFFIYLPHFYIILPYFHLGPFIKSPSV